jgi:hypothetical protein
LVTKWKWIQRKKVKLENSQSQEITRGLFSSSSFKGTKKYIFLHDERKNSTLSNVKKKMKIETFFVSFFALYIKTRAEHFCSFGSKNIDEATKADGDGDTI